MFIETPFDHAFTIDLPQTIVTRTFQGTFQGTFQDFQDRDRGKPHGSAPPTPPDMRVRIRRFGGLSDRLHRQSWNPEQGAARRLSGQVSSHIPSP